MDDKTKKKNKIYTRISALRDNGVDDSQVMKAVMAFPDLSDSMRSKLKSAVTTGQTSKALDDLQSFSKVDTGGFKAEKTKGKLGAVSDFLGMEKAGRRIGYSLAMLDPQHRKNVASLDEESQKEFKTGGVSGKEFAGSLGNTALNLAGGSLIKGGAKALGLSKTPLTGLSSKIASGPIKSGTALGAAGGLSSGMEQDKDALGIIGSTIGGAAFGGALGMVPGVVGKALGKTPLKKQVQNALKNVTPDYGDLPPSMKKELARKGQVTPRSLTKGQEVRLNDRQVATAARHADIMTSDPVQTSVNIQNKVGQLNNDVEQFLLKNNGIFSGKELKNTISKRMDEVLDVSGLGTEESMQKAKNKLIDQFISEVGKKDMHSLWKARKAFDQRIDTAFTGSDSLQKAVKKELRNAVQDFISKRTTDGVYRTYMQDMSNLLDLNDLVDISVAKQYPGSKIGELRRKLTGEISAISGVAGGLGAGYYLAGGGGRGE